jgi:uncharacterized protein YndB with AHSA1/START domain
MGPVRAEIDIDAPREEVFAVISDLALRQSFTDHFISELRLDRLESIGVGASARFRLYAPPRAMWMSTEIIATDPPHRLSERGSGGRTSRIPSGTEWELTGGPGSLVTLRVVYWTEPANHFDRISEKLGAAAHWYRRDWQQALERLRDAVEAGHAPGAAVTVAGGNRRTTGVR